jgi:hypothetical protein
LSPADLGWCECWMPDETDTMADATRRRITGSS